MTKYLSVTDTAKLLRQALKESFPGVKFSVKSSKYAGGASIHVSWIDGPSAVLVEPITSLFAGSYFDGMIDYKGSRYHTINGERASMGADYVFTNRDYSDAQILRAIDAVYLQYKRDGYATDKPTLADYKSGALYRVHVTGMHGHGNESVQADIRGNLHKRSTVATPAPSATLATIICTGDDGYSESMRIHTAEQAEKRAKQAEPVEPKKPVVLRLVSKGGLH